MDIVEELNLEVSIAKFQKRVAETVVETNDVFRGYDAIVASANDGDYLVVTERVLELADTTPLPERQLIEMLGRGPEGAGELLDLLIARQREFDLAMEWQDLCVIHEAGFPWPLVETMQAHVLKLNQQA